MLLLIPFGDRRSITRLRSCGAMARQARLWQACHFVMIDERN